MQSINAGVITQTLFMSLTLFPTICGAQSFDCHHANTPAEWAICATPELRTLDDRMAALYRLYTGPEAHSAVQREDVEKLQTSWERGRRDLCRGDVQCLADAYGEIIAALQALPPDGTATAANPLRPATVTPRCDAGTSARNTSSEPVSSDEFAQAVCSRSDLMNALQRSDTHVQQLMHRLPLAWRATLSAQQSLFLRDVGNCPIDEHGAQQCLATTINQRLRDIEDLASSIDQPALACTTSDVSIVDGKLGDAGMSKQFHTYLIRYNGSSTCQVRGYPSIAVLDAKGTRQPMLSVYSDQTYFESSPGVPLPVRLSATNPSAWFGIETASACDAPLSQTVKVALPLSQDWLRTLDFPDADCQVVVTPVAAMSTMRPAVQ